MLIVAAKGFAKEVLQIFHQLNQLENIAFYDDVNHHIDSLLYDKFPILKNDDEVKALFKVIGSEYTIGIGNPHLRYKLYKKFNSLAGIYTSVFSPLTNIGDYDIEIKEGTNILSNVSISNSTKIGKGCILYYNVVITHDCIVGDFVELSPNAILLGGVEVGSFTQIGTNATVLPRIKIGKNVIIGAGAVVTKDIPDNCVAFGSPAKVIRNLTPIQ